ncbi:DUF1861 family protein [Niallia sp. MER 6]|uniref:DUF1861 family protein n=1 Tax=Niallia sp. MER 6 TaxID=2939567 RepID=UPI0020418831|nr:DUF1861 family protein [Niallia sp. MER 6]MCM3031025.1 DUF1861 family protein [Niallia sp. MER 6]
MEKPVKALEKILREFQQQPQPTNPQKLTITGLEGKDVYNITAPFEEGGKMMIAGRVELRESEKSSVHFFTEENGKWILLQDAPVFALQDPFMTKIGGELIFGGVETFPHPKNKDLLGWRTILMKGDKIATLKEFVAGPDGMKDLRVVELSDGSIGMFTRPQGKKGGRGKIGFKRLLTLADITIQEIENTPLLEQFTDEEWGGVNEAQLLSNGMIGVLGHIAKFDERGHRHYYPMVFMLNPKTGASSEMKIIAERGNFQKGPSKRPDLKDVVFSGGIIRNSDGTAYLYAGTSDAEAQKITIPDPFLPYETKELNI